MSGGATASATEAVSQQELLTDQSVSFEFDTPLSEACRHVLRTDGKQVRPSLVREAAKFGPQSESRLVNQAAAAVELLHMASLTHDDVIDGGDMRRGTETARARYGDSVSVLTGGCLYAQAVQLLADAGDRPMRHFCEAAAEVTAGQMVETEDLFNSERSVERYMASVEGKTATLFSLSAQLGAELAGADEEIVGKLIRYGGQLGVAFQIADDVLDFLAGDLVTGKAQGGDIRRGVYTLPLLYAVRSNPELRSRLEAGDGAESLEELNAEIRRSGGFEQAVKDCARHVDAAADALAGLEGAEILQAIPTALLEKCRSEALP